jgi:uncharacterized protein (DUF305 family)
MIKNIIIVILALLVVVLGFYALNYYIYYQKQGGGMESAMHSMTGDLEGKTGAEFDQAFLEGMIVHHEGAVAMAEMARTNALRPEVKTLAEAIIASQMVEIAQMRAWMGAWYESDSHSHTH